MYCSGRRGHRTGYETTGPGVGDEADARRRRAFVASASRFGALFIVCVVLWLLNGAGAFWPLWVLVFAAVVLGRRAVDAYGRSTGPDVSDLSAYGED